MSITLLSAVKQLAMLRTGDVSPVELVDEHIQQIERLNPLLNAFVDFDAARVRRQAREVKTGPLAGLPVTVKASISTAGHRCEIGSLLHQGFIAQVDAEAVRRLRAAGVVILGTTNCPEFLMAYETDNLLYGKTSNPWDMTRTPGGSSGGESAAIASGMSAAGLGSDSGGSVREPAHFSGICAFKPTPGRIPGRGHLPPCVGPFSTLGSIGPMARTMADIALMFDVLSGQDAGDPVSHPVPRRPISLQEAKEITIGWFEDDGLTSVTKESREAVHFAASALERQGFKVRRYCPASLEAARELWWIFFVQCGAMFYAPEITGRESLLSPTFKGFLEIAAGQQPLTGAALLDAWANWDQVRGRLLSEMQRYPILLCPVCSIPAFRHGEREWSIEGQRVSYMDAMRYTQWFNVLGAPAAVVPVSRSPEGLPIGVQIAGLPFWDEAVLSIASSVERDFGYIAPPLAIAMNSNDL